MSMMYAPRAHVHRPHIDLWHALVGAASAIVDDLAAAIFPSPRSETSTTVPRRDIVSDYWTYLIK